MIVLFIDKIMKSPPQKVNSLNNSFMKFRGIHPSDVTGILYLGIFLECSMNILRMLQVNPTSVFENQIFSSKSRKYGTIADNCLTTNYNNSYIILLSCDYVIINSAIMYTFSYKQLQFWG